MAKKKPAPKKRLTMAEVRQVKFNIDVQKKGFKKAVLETALALRRPEKPPKATPAELVPADANPLPPVVPHLDPDDMILTNDINLGQFATDEIEFTEAEEKVMSEPVPLAEVRVKPTKEGTVYLSHISYTRWFNRAWGRGRWRLVKTSLPMRQNNTVVQHYMLRVHGKSAAEGAGEHPYFENNAQQTYGDAWESTVASGLRRCAKRLGIGLELWDREWCQEFLHQYCVLVKVKGRDDKISYQWRRKVDPRFWNEIDSRHDAAVPQSDRTPPLVRAPAPHANKPAASNPKADEPITGPMKIRLWARAREVKREDAEVKKFLVEAYGLSSSSDIKRRDYDDIITSIEYPGPMRKVVDISAAQESLDIPYEREPGEDG